MRSLAGLPVPAAGDGLDPHPIVPGQLALPIGAESCAPGNAAGESADPITPTSTPASTAEPWPTDPGDLSWLDGLALDADRFLAELADPLHGRPLAVRLHARGTAFADDLDECHTPAGDALAAAVRGFVATLPAPEPTKRRRGRKGRGRRRAERGTRP